MKARSFTLTALTGLLACVLVLGCKSKENISQEESQVSTGKPAQIKVEDPKKDPTPPAVQDKPNPKPDKIEPPKPGPKPPTAKKDLPAPPDVAAPPADAQKTASGLASKVIAPGTGKDKPGPNDTVEVHYSGWTTDGKMFDSSVTRGQTTTFPLNGVIPGWTEGVQLMAVGEKRRFWIPEELAYKGVPNRPQGMLVFDIELISIKEKGPVAPEGLASPPANAEKTRSGVLTTVITPGTGDATAKPIDTVTVHYNVWTRGGLAIEDTEKMKRPLKQPLGLLAPGMQETLALMKKGETRRAWMSEELAGNVRPGAKPKDLVFTFTLIDITPGEKAPEGLEKPPADAQKTPSGIATAVVKAGTGTQKPTVEDTISVHLSVYTPDGILLEDTQKMGKPISQPLGRLPKGMQEPLQMMVKGEIRRAWMNETQAGNPRPTPNPKDLVFTFELLDIVQPPPAPKDVAAPPADAEKTPSGLASKVLKPGTGEKKPQATDTVEVHYSGWTTDGKMFDSSVSRGETATFPLNGVIKGWTEGLQLMTVGEKRRFWIPKELAYNDAPGKPAGMLVFDVELISIKPKAPGMPVPVKPPVPPKK